MLGIAVGDLIAIDHGGGISLVARVSATDADRVWFWVVNGAWGGVLDRDGRLTVLRGKRDYDGAAVVWRGALPAGLAVEEHWAEIFEYAVEQAAGAPRMPRLLASRPVPPLPPPFDPSLVVLSFRTGPRVLASR